MSERERTGEAALVHACAQAGVLCVKAERLFPGFPDRMLAMPGGRLELVELKAPGESLRLSQIECHKILRRLGFAPVTLTGADEVRAWCRENL